MKKKFISIGFAAIYLAIALGVQFILMFVLMFQAVLFNMLHGRQETDFRVIVDQILRSNQYTIILTGVVNLILIAGMGLWYYFIRTRYDVSPVEYRKIMSRQSLACILGLAVCSQFLTNIIMIVFRFAFPNVFEDYLKLAEGFDINVLPAGIMLFIVAIWSPIAEELVFRAMVFRTLRKGFSFLPAALISGIVFGIYHLNWVQGVYATAMGVLLAYAYEKTNSLLGCYLFHLAFNLFSYVIEAVETSGILPDLLLGLLLLAMHGVSLVGFGFLLWRFSKIYPKRVEEKAEEEKVVNENEII